MTLEELDFKVSVGLEYLPLLKIAREVVGERDRARATAAHLKAESARIKEVREDLVARAALTDSGNEYERGLFSGLLIAAAGIAEVLDGEGSTAQELAADVEARRGEVEALRGELAKVRDQRDRAQDAIERVRKICEGPGKHDADHLHVCPDKILTALVLDGSEPARVRCARCGSETALPVKPGDMAVCEPCIAEEMGSAAAEQIETLDGSEPADGGENK